MARVLALPLAAMLGLILFIVAGEVQNYRAAGAVSGSVRLTLSVQDLIHELQRERGFTNAALSGDARYRSDMGQQRLRSDAARTVLDKLIAHNALVGATAVRTAVALLDDQRTVRASVDAGAAEVTATFDYYTRAIDKLSGLDINAAQTGDGLLRQDLLSLQAFGDAKEALAKERGFLNGVFIAGKFRGDEYPRFADIRGAKRAALTQFERYATAGQRARADVTLRSAAATRAATYEETATAAGDGRVLKIEAHLWWDAMTVLVDDLHGVQQTLGTDAQGRAAQLRHSATNKLLVLLGLASMILLIMLVELVLLIVSARSITEPLAQLALEADDVASRRLPEAVARIQTASEDQSPPEPAQIPANASPEIRQVAEAFDNVQRVAHALAIDQALLRRNTTASLANLGRRNQNLLRRQLGFISRLEREETDPTALANLFELDHLATRMRRNAESLLILVGEATPRRWTAPVPFADVIRAAVSEVEEYRRVDMRRIDDAYLAGPAVTDVTHMIAELVENGLAFSPPELDVEIYGRWISRQYLVAIVDQGVGMTDEELATANARLRGEENFLLRPARFLGHYVVGRLAHELGAAVQLAQSPVTGVTARLVVPSDLVTSSAEQAAPEPEPQADSPRQESAAPPKAFRPLEVPTRSIGVVRAGRNISGSADQPAASTVSRRPPSKDPVTVSARGTNGRSPAAVQPDRTPNGLVKRKRRTQVPAQRQPSPALDASASTVEREPSEVHAMLSAFRAGTTRGESHSTTTQAPEGSPR